MFDKICQKSLTANSLIDHGHSSWHRDGDEPASAEVVENRNSIGFLSAGDLKTVPSFGERGGRTGCWGASVIATTLRSKYDIFGIVILINKALSRLKILEDLRQYVLKHGTTC